MGNESTFPLHALPSVMGNIIRKLSDEEGYSVSFLSVSMLTAISTVIGNTIHLNVRKGWRTNASLYVLLVGGSGSGKSRAMRWAMRPIYAINNKIVREFTNLRNQAKKNKTKMPTIPRLVVQDFTIEALATELTQSPHGLLVMVDEFKTLLQGCARNAQSNTTSNRLLSIWDGEGYTVIRKTQDDITVTCPFVNIIGSIQTRRVRDFYTRDNMDSGFTHRFIIVQATRSETSRPVLDPNETDMEEGGTTLELQQSWSEAISRIWDITLDVDEDGSPNPRHITYTTDARMVLYPWIDAMQIMADELREDDERIERIQRRIDNTIRMSLIIQFARYAFDNASIDSVDASSVSSAISIMDYYERSQEQVYEYAMSRASLPDIQERWYDSLPETFTTAEAQKCGEILEVGPRRIRQWLETYSKGSASLFTHLSHGFYRKKS